MLDSEALGCLSGLEWPPKKHPLSEKFLIPWPQVQP